MSTRFSLAITLVVALAATQTTAHAKDWLTLSQPQFITASFEDPAPEAAEPVASCASRELGACDSCFQTDCRCGCWDFGASVEATFLWPMLNSTTTATEVANIGAGTSTIYQSGANATDDMLVAPRIWVGAKRNCWGIGARYWSMEQSSGTLNTALVAPATPIFQLDRSLEAYTVDLEVTREMSILRSDAILSFGARYAYLNSGSASSSTAAWVATPLSMSSATAVSSRQFGGTGLTLGLQGTRRIRCSNWHLFYNARGSILWGDGVVGSSATAVALDAGAGAAAAAGAGFAAGDTGDMFIGELQLGLQYERQLKCLPCKAFVRGAVEYQYWDTDVNAFTAAIAIADTSGTGGAYGAAAGATAGDTIMDLFGFTLGTGLMW